jgi:hypothetical protein
MIHQVTPKIAAIALGLAMVVSLVGAQSAHAGISVPLPPPSITDPPQDAGSRGRRPRLWGVEGGAALVVVVLAAFAVLG